MSLFRVFVPHILGVTGAILWLLISFQLFKERTVLIGFLSLTLYILLFLTLAGLTPSRWLHAAPTQDQSAEIAAVFSFGYEIIGAEIKPGEANQYLWEWIVHNKPAQLRIILVQEGIWIAADRETLKHYGIEMMRMHQHDPRTYVDTLNAAYCSIQEIQKLGKRKIMLVAHDLQIQRVAWDFERVAQINCPECVFVIPEIDDVPYPTNSVHFQTQSKFIYKITELLIARPRDFLNPVPTRCIAPISTQ